MGSAAARLLRLWVWIPPGGMCVCCECCVWSGRGLSDGLITRPEESYRLWCFWMWSWILDNEGALAHCGAVAPLKKNLSANKVVIVFCRSVLLCSFNCITGTIHVTEGYSCLSRRPLAASPAVYYTSKWDKNSGWFKKTDTISYAYISWTIHGMWMIYITLERGGPKFSNITARALA